LGSSYSSFAVVEPLLVKVLTTDRDAALLLVCRSTFQILCTVEDIFPNGRILNPSGEVLNGIDSVLDLPMKFCSTFGVAVVLSQFAEGQ
jgi:hypothetical protein